MDKKIKALFFDIDGTLVSFKTHKIPQSTVDALEQAKKNGVEVYISYRSSATHHQQPRSDRTSHRRLYYHQWSPLFCRQSGGEPARHSS